MAGVEPALSVVVCTRNRPDDLRACVASILASPNRDFELLVIDQSDGKTELAELSREDPRLRHVAVSSRGLSRARNEALARAGAPLIAFTDDDCRVQSDFAERVLDFFRQRPEVAMAFGKVDAPLELQQRGHVATFAPQELSYRGRFPSPMEPWGIGANMAMRRVAVERAGAFDPELGAGATIPAGEELDFTIRVIGAGLVVATTGAFSVLHLGVREHAAARALFLGYMEGAGAAYAKNIRLGTPGSTPLALAWLFGVQRVVLRAALERRRPLGVGLLLAGLRGGVKALQRPIDSQARPLRRDS